MNVYRLFVGSASRTGSLVVAVVGSNESEAGGERTLDDAQVLLPSSRREKRVERVLAHLCTCGDYLCRWTCRAYQVKLTEGEYTNLKLTTPDDLVVASQILEARRKHGGAKDLDDDDDDGEERLSVKRANARWSDSPPTETKPPATEEVENLSIKRANEGLSETSVEASAVTEDPGPENLSIKRANQSWADTSAGKGVVAEEGDKEAAPTEKKSIRDRPPPERVSPNRTPPPKPDDMDAARAALREKREKMWKDQGAEPPLGRASPPAPKKPEGPQTDIFSKE